MVNTPSSSQSTSPVSSDSDSDSDSASTNINNVTKNMNRSFNPSNNGTQIPIRYVLHYIVPFYTGEIVDYINSNEVDIMKLLTAWNTWRMFGIEKDTEVIYDNTKQVLKTLLTSEHLYFIHAHEDMKKEYDNISDESIKYGRVMSDIKMKMLRICDNEHDYEKDDSHLYQLWYCYLYLRDMLGGGYFINSFVPEKNQTPAGGKPTLLNTKIDRVLLNIITWKDEISKFNYNKFMVDQQLLPKKEANSLALKLDENAKATVNKLNEGKDKIPDKHKRFRYITYTYMFSRTTKRQRYKVDKLSFIKKDSDAIDLEYNNLRNNQPSKFNDDFIVTMNEIFDFEDIPENNDKDDQKGELIYEDDKNNTQSITINRENNELMKKYDYISIYHLIYDDYNTIVNNKGTYPHAFAFPNLPTISTLLDNSPWKLLMYSIYYASSHILYYLRYLQLDIEIAFNANLGFLRRDKTLQTIFLFDDLPMSPINNLNQIPKKTDVDNILIQLYNPNNVQPSIMSMKSKTRSEFLELFNKLDGSIDTIVPEIKSTARKLFKHVEKSIQPGIKLEDILTSENPNYAILFLLALFSQSAQLHQVGFDSEIKEAEKNKKEITKKYKTYMNERIKDDSKISFVNIIRDLLPPTHAGQLRSHLSGFIRPNTTALAACHNVLTRLQTEVKSLADVPFDILIGRTTKEVVPPPPGQSASSSNIGHPIVPKQPDVYLPWIDPTKCSATLIHSLRQDFASYVAAEMNSIKLQHPRVYQSTNQYMLIPLAHSNAAAAMRKYGARLVDETTNEWTIYRLNTSSSSRTVARPNYASSLSFW